MPALTKDDVQGYSLTRVVNEMKTRYDEAEKIQKNSEGSFAKAEGDQATAAAAIYADLNLLGERHDELKALEGADEKAAKLNEWLNTPAGEPPPHEPKATKREQYKDAATLIAESEWYVEKHGTGKTEVPFDALFGVKVLGEDATLAGVDDEFPPQSIRIPGIRVPVLFQSNNVSNMFLQGTTDQFSVAYMQETVTSQGAAETSEGAAKPEADISFTEATSPVENIAVTLPVTNQLLEDVSLMRSWVQGRLRLFVENREDSQLLNGTGVAPQIEGILTVAGTNAESYSIAAADTASTATVAHDAVFRGMTAVREAFLNPTGIVMAAGTWERFRLTQNANLNYLHGDPGGSDVTPRLWGLPVTLNENMPAEAATNEPIAVVAREAAMVARRNSVTLAVTDSHASEFSTNVLRFRAEVRTAFPIFRPAGISVVTSNA